MFIRSEGNSDDAFEPDFTIINACKITAENWKDLGLKSEVFVAFNIEKKLAVIGGTWYGGEMKKVMLQCVLCCVRLSELTMSFVGYFLNDELLAAFGRYHDYALLCQCRQGMVFFV